MAKRVNVLRKNGITLTAIPDAVTKRLGNFEVKDSYGRPAGSYADMVNAERRFDALSKEKVANVAAPPPKTGGKHPSKYKPVTKQAVN